MKIAIIGTGNVGSALAYGLAGKGYDLILGTRSVDSANVTELAEKTGAKVDDPVAAADIADIVILSLPWTVAEEAVPALGDLSGKIVIDCMNPLGMVDGALGLTIGHNRSGGEIVATWLPGALVVKTLNQVGAEIMARNDHLPLRPVMFMAGNDAQAKEAVSAILTALGFQPMDAGDITKSRLLEPFGMVWINQALMQGAGRDWAFAAASA